MAAVCSRAGVAIDLLPGFAAYIDLALAWGAFLFAALTARSWSSKAQWVALGVAGLGLTAAASGTLAGVSAVQSLFSYALLGAPFALVAAILLAPPSAPQRKHLITVALALAFIQVPIAIAQALQATHADQVQGTFIGSEAGAHLVGALGVWPHSGSSPGREPHFRRWPPRRCCWSPSSARRTRRSLPCPSPCSRCRRVPRLPGG